MLENGGVGNAARALNQLTGWWRKEWSASASAEYMISSQDGMVKSFWSDRNVEYKRL